MDADCSGRPRWWEGLEPLLGEDSGVGLITSGAGVHNPECSATIPHAWVVESQLFVRNHLFHGINGFSEGYVGWGCEVHDFAIRAAELAGVKTTRAQGRRRIAYTRVPGLCVTPHHDRLRWAGWDGGERETAWRRAARAYARRGIVRAGAGVPVGSGWPAMPMWSRGRAGEWRYGESA